MNKIIIAVVIIIALAAGTYWYMNNNEAATPAETGTSMQETQQPDPQVAGQDAVVGEGAEAVPGATVSVLYVGMLEDGTVFDSSANNNNEPLSFTLGTPGIIPGFQIGVRGMREGGERRIQIPPELGYGAQEITDANGTVIIPANSTITFDIRLVSVTAPAEALTEESEEVPAQ